MEFCLDTSTIMAMLILLVVTVVALLTVFVAGVRGQIDSCASDLSTFLPSLFNSTGLSCRPIWHNFILRYGQDENYVMSIVLSATYTSGWVGMGFSEDGMMVGSNAVVGWIGRDGRAHINQFYLEGRTASQVVANEGRLRVTEPALVLYGLNMYLAFRLNFSAPVAQHNLLFAFAAAVPVNYRLTEHDDRISVLFDFSGGSAPKALSTYPYNLKRNHGALSVLGWGVLLPIGAIVARHFRHRDPLWYNLHVAVQFAGFMFGLAGAVSGISLYSKLHSNVSTHRGLGILVLALCSLQVVAFFVRPVRDSKIRKYWNWYHHWIGRLALFVAAVNIVLGIHVGGAGLFWKVGYGTILTCILIATTVLETIPWHKNSVASPAF